MLTVKFQATAVIEIEVFFTHPALDLSTSSAQWQPGVRPSHRADESTAITMLWWLVRMPIITCLFFVMQSLFFAPEKTTTGTCYEHICQPIEV